MRIATFNAASIRARLDGVLEWLSENEPDVLAIQETKVENEKFPVSDFEELGYNVVLNGQKSWNGVAVLSLIPPTNVILGFGDELVPNDARILACKIGDLNLVNTYVPNGSEVGSDKFEYKLKWLERFNRMIRERYRPDDKLVWLGDINIAPRSGDVYDSAKFLGKVGHHPLEFAGLQKIVDFGLTDVFTKHDPSPGKFTYWDFVIPNSVPRNLGWRIDHIYATAPVAEKSLGCEVDKEARTRPKPSDHTFVTATFDL